MRSNMVNVNNFKKNEQNIVFFIGSGFTKSVINAAPLGHEFFIKAFDSKSQIANHRQIKRIKTFIKKIYYPPREENYPNIEDVLSLIDYTIQKKDVLSDYSFEDLIIIRSDLIYMMGKVIKETLEKTPEEKDAVLEKNRELGGRFVEKLQELIVFSNISIISTNYDLIVDNALILKLKSCNYGIKLRYNIPIYQTNADSRPNGSVEWNFYNVGGNINNDGLPLLKIHGSLNWFYCPKCDELDITIGEKGIIDHVESESKILCVNPYCTSSYEPLLVTPTMLKVYDNSFLRKLWQLSEDKVSEAHKLVFIGYSLSDADYHIRSLLTKALVNNEKIEQIMVVVKKPDNDEERKLNQSVKNKYERLFGEHRVNFQDIGSDGFLNKWDVFFSMNP